MTLGRWMAVRSDVAGLDYQRLRLWIQQKKTLSQTRVPRRPITLCVMPD